MATLTSAAPTTTCELVPDGAGSDYEQETDDTPLPFSRGDPVSRLGIITAELHPQSQNVVAGRRSPVEFNNGVARLQETVIEPRLPTTSNRNFVEPTNCHTDSQRVENGETSAPILPFIISASRSSTLPPPLTTTATTTTPTACGEQSSRGYISENAFSLDNTLDHNPNLTSRRTSDSFAQRPNGGENHGSENNHESGRGMTSHIGSTISQSVLDLGSGNSTATRTAGDGSFSTPPVSWQTQTSLRRTQSSVPLGHLANDRLAPSWLANADSSLANSGRPILHHVTRDTHPVDVATRSGLTTSLEPRVQSDRFLAQRAQSATDQYRVTRNPSTTSAGYNNQIWSQSQQADEINHQRFAAWPTPEYSRQGHADVDHFDETSPSPFERQSPPVVVPRFSSGQGHVNGAREYKNSRFDGDLRLKPTESTTPKPQATKAASCTPVSDSQIATVDSAPNVSLNEPTVSATVAPTPSGAFDIVKRSIYSTIILDKYCRFEETIQRRNLKRSFDVYNADANCGDGQQQQQQRRSSCVRQGKHDTVMKCCKEGCRDAETRLATLWANDSGTLHQFLVDQRKNVLEQLNKLTTAEQVQTLSAMSIAYSASREEDHEEASVAIEKQCSISSIVRDVVFDTLETDSVQAKVDQYVSMKSVKRLVESILVELEQPKDTTKRQRASQTISDLNNAFVGSNTVPGSQQYDQQEAGVSNGYEHGAFGGNQEDHHESSQQWLQRVMKKVAAAGACVLGSVALRYCCGSNSGNCENPATAAGTGKTSCVIEPRIPTLESAINRSPPLSPLNTLGCKSIVVTADELLVATVPKPVTDILNLSSRMGIVENGLLQQEGLVKIAGSSGTLSPLNVQLPSLARTPAPGGLDTHANHGTEKAFDILPNTVGKRQAPLLEPAATTQKKESLIKRPLTGNGAASGSAVLPQSRQHFESESNDSSLLDANSCDAVLPKHLHSVTHTSHHEKGKNGVKTVSKKRKDGKAVERCSPLTGVA